MKAKKHKLHINFISAVLIYVFGMLYLQLVELFFGISITKVVFLLFLFIILFGVFTKSIKIGPELIPIVIAAACYFLMYYRNLPQIISYVYPPLILAVLIPVFFRNDKEKVSALQLDILSWLIFIYLIINLLLALLHYKGSFQMASGEEQFKGALPHSNMFCSVMIALYAMIFKRRGLITILSRILVVLLIVITGSRSFIVAIALLLILQVLSRIGKNYSTGAKLFLAFLVLAVIGPPAVLLIVNFVPSMYRFILYGFTGNGRQILQSAYSKAIASSNLNDLFLGINVTKRYLSVEIVEFSHSFTENSFMAIFLLFGIVGVVYFGICVLKAIFRSKSITSAGIIIVFLITFFVQDTLLSLQTSLFTVVGIYLNNLMYQKQGLPVKSKYHKSTVKVEAVRLGHHGRKNLGDV